MKRIRISLGSGWTDLWEESDKDTKILFERICEKMEDDECKCLRIKDLLFVKSNIKFIEYGKK